ARGEDWARPLDAVDQGFFHAALSRAGRGRARAAMPVVSLGRRPQRTTVLALPGDGRGGRVLTRVSYVAHSAAASRRSVQEPRCRLRPALSNAGAVRRDQPGECRPDPPRLAT